MLEKFGIVSLGTWKETALLEHHSVPSLSSIPPCMSRWTEAWRVGITSCSSPQTLRWQEKKIWPKKKKSDEALLRPRRLLMAAPPAPMKGAAILSSRNLWRNLQARRHRGEQPAHCCKLGSSSGATLSLVAGDPTLLLPTANSCTRAARAQTR